MTNYNPLVDRWIIVDRLADIILHHVPGCVVEVGIGYSTLVLAKHAQNVGVTFYTCDTRQSRCNWAKETVSYDKMIIYNGRSSRFMKQFDDSPSIVLIDGNHYSGIVREEVNFFIDKLRYGGVIFMHDTCPLERTYIKKTTSGKIMDTHLVRKELELRDDVDILTWRYTAGDCGLTMVYKKDLTEPEYRR